MNQVADYLCTMELTALKYGDRTSTATDEKFFGSWNLFKKGSYKEMRRKALQEMKRMPELFKRGDRVRFDVGDGTILEGTVVVVDPRGGGINFGVCPSYDIKTEDTIYKHIPAQDVQLVEERNCT